MICSNCKEEIGDGISEHTAADIGGFIYFTCSPKAERSEAVPRCPPSATGSAGARASDEAGADSLGRSADKAVLCRAQLLDDLVRCVVIIALSGIPLPPEFANGEIYDRTGYSAATHRSIVERCQRLMKKHRLHDYTATTTEEPETETQGTGAHSGA